jgi:hypothetical protein
MSPNVWGTMLTGAMSENEKTPNVGAVTKPTYTCENCDEYGMPAADAYYGHSRLGHRVEEELFNDRLRVRVTLGRPA